MSALSQTALKSDAGDTLICFSVPRAKYILKKMYEAEACDSLFILSKQREAICDSAFKACQNITVTCTKEISTQDTLSHIQEKEIERLKQVVITEQKNTQKVGQKKVIWEGISIFLAGVVIYEAGRKK